MPHRLLQRSWLSAILGVVSRDWQAPARSQRPADERAPAPTGAAPADPRALLGALGNRQLARLAKGEQVLARDPAAGGVATKPPAKPDPIIGPWGIEIENPQALAAYFRVGAMQVESELKGIQADKDLTRRSEEWIKEANDWAHWFDTSPDKTLSDDDIRAAHKVLDERGVGLRKEIQYIADAPKRDALRRAAENAERVAKETEKLAPKMADTARAAFKSGDESLLSDIADITGNVTDIGLGIHELARKISEEIADTRGIELPAVSKYTEALDKLNKGLAIINLGLSLAGEKGKTELDEGLRWVGISAGAFSSLGTIVGLPAHMGLYANLYLVPLTKACIAGVQRIGDLVHEENKSWVEFIGEPANYMVEPGGKPMWDFMLAVMRAKDEKGVPALSDEIAEYFEDHKGAFNAGAARGFDMPMSGMIFKSLDRGEARSWIFYRRKQLWSMLYGSMKVPDKKKGR
jgi:hypothetical protein